MRRPILSKMLENISNVPTEEERSFVLKVESDRYPEVSQLLRMAYDPQVKFTLQKGRKPYDGFQSEKFDYPEVPFYTYLKKIYVFLDNHPFSQRPQHVRDNKFREVLENICASDAELLLAIKDKKLPDNMKGLSKEFVHKTLPHLWVEEEKIKNVKKKTV